MEIQPEISINDLEIIRGQLLKFAKLQLQHHELAEDLVQETFICALKNMGNFKGKAALKTWFFAILKNKIIDHLRQKGRWILESELSDEEENHFFDQKGHWKMEYQPQALQEHESAVYSDEFWKIFEACLTHLPAKQARVFMMREYLEYSSDEICIEIGLSAANVYTILYRARLQLQHCLSTHL